MKIRRFARALALIGLICLLLVVFTQTRPEGIAFEWKTATPEAHGLSADRLARLTEQLKSRGTRAFLVIRDDRLVWEWYGEDFGPGQKHYSASVAKAVVGGVSLALLLDDGLVQLDDPVSRWAPQWASDPAKSRITIGHLASHSSGLEDVSHEQLDGWRRSFWKRSPDPFSVVRDNVRLIAEPGREFHYSSAGMMMLGYALAAALERSRSEDLRELLRDRVYGPLGFSNGDWSIGYGQTLEVDGLKLVPIWGGATFTPRSLAKIGRLLLRKGDWEGARILSQRAAENLMYEPTAPVPVPTPSDPQPAAGLGWFHNRNGAWIGVPRDAVCAAGAGHQVLLVVPSLRLIVVRNGEQLTRADESLSFWKTVDQYLLTPTISCITESQPPSS